MTNILLFFLFIPVIFIETKEVLVHNYSHCANVALCIGPMYVTQFKMTQKPKVPQ